MNSSTMIGHSKSRPMEILLVEDGLLDARVTILALRRSGVHHRLTLVRTLGEAKHFLRRDGVFARAPVPDLLLLDIMLPDGSGIEVLETIAELGGDLARTTTVVLSASLDTEIRRRCTEENVHDFIAKPVREEDFLRVVREHKHEMVRTAQQLVGV